MQANSSGDTAPELALRSALHRVGFRYYTHRRPIRDLRCTADIVFPRMRVCVFVDGCFWHGCEEHRRAPVANSDYWGPKIARNVERDRRNNAILREMGWTVIRIWEHEPVEAAIGRIAEMLAARA
jgi:DNA mismatch endonuclease (patch repair protein)